MPHHKDCWIENQGCTTFGCNGTVQSVEGSSFEQEPADLDYDVGPRLSGDAAGAFDSTYCPSCGTKHDAGDLFCRTCGYDLRSRQTAGAIRPLTQQSSGSSGTSDSSSNHSRVEDEEGRYIVNNLEFYKAKFGEMRSEKKQTSWNWAAFFFAPYWCMYRKLYGAGAAALAVVFILSFFGWGGSIILFIGSLIFGMYANYLYMIYVQQLVRDGKNMQEPEKSQHARKKGGVSPGMAVLIIIAYGVFRAILLW